MNADLIYEQIEKAALRSGRNGRDITLVAVSKKQSVEKISAYHEYCNRHSLRTIIGENYIQELKEKKTLLSPDIEIHFIGHLQSNKSKDAATFSNCIESVDSYGLARKLNMYCEELEEILPVFLQVNISKDSGKSGLYPDNVEAVYEQILSLRSLKVAGLMAITQIYGKPEEARGDFRALKALSTTIEQRLNTGPLELSMGMSDDFTYAIEEGATTVRVGSALFGSRSA